MAVPRLFILTLPPSKFLFLLECFNQVTASSALCHHPALTPGGCPALLTLSNHHSLLHAAPEPGARQEQQQQPGKKIKAQSKRSFFHPQWCCPHLFHLQWDWQVLGSWRAVSFLGTNQLSKVYLYECSQLFPLHKFTQRLS